eukprot:4723265-Alexandrium_andersonii.AAC.1
MSASLVGSEMCIRDRLSAGRVLQASGWTPHRQGRYPDTRSHAIASSNPCLLYTSDAADDM